MRAEADDFRGGVRWLPVKNTHGTEAPAFALLKMTGVTDDGIVEVTRPDADSLPLVRLLVNGPSVIKAGQSGQAHNQLPAAVFYHDADSVAVGDSLGSAASQWYAKKNKTGLLALDAGDPTADLVNVGLVLGATFSGARVFHSLDNDCSSGTETSLAFNSEQYDTDGYHNTVSNTHLFTIPSTGKYGYGFRGDASFVGGSSSATLIHMLIKHSGSLNVASAISQYAAAGTTSIFLAVSGESELAQNETIHTGILHSGGVTLRVNDGAPANGFWIHRIG